jgi:hypothetical protein
LYPLPYLTPGKNTKADPYGWQFSRLTGARRAEFKTRLFWD